MYQEFDVNSQCLSDAMNFIRSEISKYIANHKTANQSQLMAEESINRLLEHANLTEKNKRLTRKKAAFEELETLRRKIPDLDYDKELAIYRDEKFGNAHSACYKISGQREN